MGSYYVTKYALTTGILAVEAEECGDDMIRCSGRFHQYFHREGRDWHRTFDAALAKATEMRDEKIASLRKQIGRLERIAFSKPESSS
jgi:hypothetical protein